MLHLLKAPTVLGGSYSRYKMLSQNLQRPRRQTITPSMEAAIVATFMWSLPGLLGSKDQLLQYKSRLYMAVTN